MAHINLNPKIGAVVLGLLSLNSSVAAERPIIRGPITHWDDVDTTIDTRCCTNLPQPSRSLVGVCQVAVNAAKGKTCIRFTPLETLIQSALDAIQDDQAEQMTVVTSDIATHSAAIDSLRLRIRNLEERLRRLERE